MYIYIYIYICAFTLCCTLGICSSSRCRSVFQAKWALLVSLTILARRVGFFQAFEQTPFKVVNQKFPSLRRARSDLVA